MKAFVLKNNEGLYYTTHRNYEDVHTEDIDKANILDRETANNVKWFLDTTTHDCGEKWEVVEITIAESDLEKQIRKQVCDEVRKVIDYYREWYEQGYIIDMREEDLLKEIDKIEQAKR